MLTVQSRDGHAPYATDVAELCGIREFDADPYLVQSLDHMAMILQGLVLALKPEQRAAVLRPVLVYRDVILVEQAK